MKFERWSIWLANLDPVMGSEQGKTRPVIILSENQINEVLSVVNVVPLTSRKKERSVYPNEDLLPAKHSGLKKESIVLCYQIRTLDKKRLVKWYGKLKDEALQQEIIDALSFQLGME
ncbi:MAG: type II toxin-antitoxin system PemK/MazF family toxin [Bacteroidetes bacterium]|nr:type II toxin-antitoxin system PemK/MazF family toxin [Bacteroidota bacterium]